jgi:hypothetical protein
MLTADHYCKLQFIESQYAVSLPVCSVVNISFQ